MQRSRFNRGRVYQVVGVLLALVGVLFNLVGTAFGSVPANAAFGLIFVAVGVAYWVKGRRIGRL